MDTTVNWPELLQHPLGGDHIVQVYQDERFLAETVAQYIGTGLRRGEAAVLIVTPAHAAGFRQALDASGCSTEQALRSGQLRLLDAESTLSQLTKDGAPDWTAFHACVGGTIAELRLQYPTVRAYGEMVDVLWQRGERQAAMRLEEFWNELAG